MAVLKPHLLGDWTIHRVYYFYYSLGKNNYWQNIYTVHYNAKNKLTTRPLLMHEYYTQSIAVERINHCGLVHVHKRPLGFFVCLALRIAIVRADPEGCIPTHLAVSMSHPGPTGWAPGPLRLSRGAWVFHHRECLRHYKPPAEKLPRAARSYTFRHTGTAGDVRTTKIVAQLQSSSGPPFESSQKKKNQKKKTRPRFPVRWNLILHTDRIISQKKTPDLPFPALSCSSPTS